VTGLGTWKLDIAEQTRGVLENMKNVLAVAGADLSHVVDLTCFLIGACAAPCCAVLRHPTICCYFEFAAHLTCFCPVALQT
jgi:hypothetical protein